MKKFSNKFKIIITISCLFIFALSSTACTIIEDKVVSSLGKYEKYEFFSSGEFQDYTDYAKYYYTSTKVEDNQYLKKIQESDMETIIIHLDDFESWIKEIKRNDTEDEVVVNYDFDRKIIDTEDYFYIDSEERTWDDGTTLLVSYNIYLFDTQTQILYYFHNNI